MLWRLNVRRCCVANHLHLTEYLNDPFWALPRFAVSANRARNIIVGLSCSGSHKLLPRGAGSVSVAPAAFLGGDPPSREPAARKLLAQERHRVTYSSSSYAVLFSFGSGAGSQVNGGSPIAGLTDAAGIFYGTTIGGGQHGDGTVYSITDKGAERVLVSFGYHNGARPAAGLLAIKHKLYGTTSTGYGSVFSMNVNGTNFTVLHNFQSGSDGSQPLAAVIRVGNKLYGTTIGGGKYGGGTVFSLDLTGAREKVLHSFGYGSDGLEPEAPLVYSGNALYGTTYEGGGKGVGTVFRMTLSGKETVLHSFSGVAEAKDGGYPTASLLTENGEFYGTTTGGGTYGGGTVFSITSSGVETVLHSFGEGTDGKTPAAGLVAVDALLYGTTAAGGAYGYGTLFSIDSSGAENELHSFGYGSDGKVPMAPLTYVNGGLYGTTEFGGSGSGSCPSTCPPGTVFVLKISPKGRRF